MEGKKIDILLGLATAAVLAACAVVFWHRTPLDEFDEIHMYLGDGLYDLRFVQWKPDWSPYYAYWYRFLSFFEGEPAPLAYLNQTVLPLLLLVSLWGLLLRLGWSPPAAAISILLLAAHPFIWLSDIKVSHFALFASALCAQIALAFPRRHWQFAIALPLTALLPFARPELILIFPGVAFVYLIALIRNRKSRGSWVFGQFGLSLFLGLGILFYLEAFSGKKADWVYFVKHWERYEEIGNNPYPSADALKAALFPKATGVMTAIFENPGECVKHAAHHLRTLGTITVSYFRGLFGVNPWLAWAVTSSSLLGLYFCFRQEAGKQTPYRNFALPVFIFFVLVIPCVVTAAIFGTLWRYNVAILFVAFSLWAAPLLALPAHWQRRVLALCLGIFLLSFVSWRDAVYARIPAGIWNHYVSFGRQMRAVLVRDELRYLAACGTIFTIVSRSPKESTAFEFLSENLIHEGAIGRDLLLRSYDVVIFCDQHTVFRSRDFQAYVKELRQIMAREHKEFAQFRILPMQADVFVRHGLFHPGLPLGVTRVR